MSSNGQDSFQARSRAPLTKEIAQIWEDNVRKPPDESFNINLKKCKSNPDFFLKTVVEEHVLKPSDIRREVKLAKLRVIGSVFEELAIHALRKSKSSSNLQGKRNDAKKTADSELRSKYKDILANVVTTQSDRALINRSYLTKSIPVINEPMHNTIKGVTELKTEQTEPDNRRTFKIGKAPLKNFHFWERNMTETTSESKVSSKQFISDVTEEHTIKPSMVKVRTKIAKILGKGSDEELLSKLKRCRYSGDTPPPPPSPPPMIACRTAITKSHGSSGIRGSLVISLAENLQKNQREQDTENVLKSGCLAVLGKKMPKLPSSSSKRETLTTPRSARVPPTQPSFRRPASSAATPCAATLPRRRVTKFLEKPPPGSPDSMDSHASSDLRRQNDELKSRLSLESAEHRRRLDAYKRAQQGQAALVSRLQSKVLQYKQRCAELEGHVSNTAVRHPTSSQPLSSAIALPAPHDASSFEAKQKDSRIEDLETALRCLEEEKRKCEKLLNQNNLLREQLEESQQINEALTNDLQKLTNDWENLREEILLKEDEWKDEEQAFNDYYATEHNRLLALWRDVVSIKRGFSEMQTSTERELIKFKADVDTKARDLLGTFGSFSMNAIAAGHGLKNLEQQSSKVQHSSTAEHLHNELREVTAQKDKAILDLRERDNRIQKLLSELQRLEEKCESLESSSEETAVVRSALEEVARALIADSETNQSHSLERSPKRVAGQWSSPTGFAESTISAVHAALHKYQLHIHQLQVKLDNSREQLTQCKKHCESVDANNNTLESKLYNLQGKLDEAVADISQSQQEKEVMHKTIEGLRHEKSILEQTRIELNAMVESLSSDYEKLQSIKAKLEKTVELLESEKRDMKTDMESLQRDIGNRDAALRKEEEISSRLRTELLTLREELNSSQLSVQLLQQSKAQCEADVAHFEKQRDELEMELDRIISERNDLQCLNEKLLSNVDLMQRERKRLSDELKQLEEEKSNLSNQSSDHQCDLNALKKELLMAEENKMELESEKASQLERIKLLECDKERYEFEIAELTRDKNELCGQLTASSRKIETLNEEIVRLQQRFEQCNEMNSRLNRSLEDLVKENEEKQIEIDKAEKDKQHIHEQLCSLMCEKDALEASLFDTSNQLDNAEQKCKRIEYDLQNALVAQEKLKGQITRLKKEIESSEKKYREEKASYSQNAGKKEVEYQNLITKLNVTATENIAKLNEEKEHIRQSLEQKLAHTIATLNSEKEVLEANLREKERKWRTTKENLITQHDEALLRAENEKQQALLMAQQDMQALKERLEETKHLLENEQSNLERLKRDSQSKIDQDRILTNLLKEEISAYKMKLDEAKSMAEDVSARNDSKIKELELERDNLQRDIRETKTQLQLSEEKCDCLSRELNDTLRKMKEVESECESIRRDLLETRRELQTRVVERDQLSATCTRLREHVTRAESEKRDAARQTQESYHKISALEESRSQLDAERTKLQTLLKESESSIERCQRESQSLEDQLKRERSGGEQAANELKELQARLSNECEERVRMSNEAGAARRRAAELEALLHAARTDLQRHHRRAAELQNALRARDQELALRLEDCRSKERRLEELKHNLEVCLADATQQIQELKARLGGCESRCRGLEEQLAACEAERRDAQLKLSSVARTLRRVAGIQPDGSLHPPARVTSPARRYSPRRGRDHSEERNEIIDVDPEALKKGVRSLMHEINQVEREKEDFKSQLCATRKQLKEASDQQGKGEGKLCSIAKNLRQAQDSAAKLQSQVTQKDGVISTQNETIQSKTMEVNTLRDKIHHLENSIVALSEEKGQCEVNGEKIRSLLSERDSEVAQLREALTESETRISRLQLKITHLTADLQRASQRCSSLENACSKQKQECESHMRTMTALEERCTSLKNSIEQLSASLQKAASHETELKSELSKLQRQFNDAKLNEQSAAEKLRQCQKSLSNAENERKVLSDKLESAKQQCVEIKRNNASLEDQIHRLNSQIAHLEVQRTGLESRLRVTSYDGKDITDTDLERELRTIQMERDELKTKVDRMHDTILKLEAENRIEKSRSRSKERVDRQMYCTEIESVTDYQITRRKPGGGISPEFALLEVENRELRMKIRRLEKDLSDKEMELSELRPRACESGSIIDRDTFRLLEAKEASYRQKIRSLEHQVSQLRSQLSNEISRRERYVNRSGKATRDMQRLRAALGDSLRTVSQEPSLDSYLLENEARKLDHTLAHSLPPYNDSFDSTK